ncbi:23S rRNA (guanosine(2251)-2'-O)-methyltransferase RlmB [Thiomicrospira sp. ALE5]|uniref:23S rRNA (guanosine(2251)-2'-O)-methyltransferase RlmB n=1 Tax=Thiomicrospira sp. ALE5 TaxID=748650 RepID=UPI0008F15539|nr:23S rRNA (guanosine(2251)-2'-O)-methyltransferase RlmB [Thiomicrospira sp. ALE5]SFR53037.1 23S rRNA Gm-2251 2'-O-methyltransferase [Thiomicrospira sp. ALE5]
MTEKVYGLHALEPLLDKHPEQVFQLVFCEGRLNARQQSLHDQAMQLGVKIQTAPKKVFDQLVGVHQGVYADVAAKAAYTEADLMDWVANKPNPLLVFLDEVQDPHNLGAILRTADATGVTAVVVPKNNAVGLNATVRKVACGGAESVPLVVVTNLVRTMEQLQQQGVWFTGLAGETEQTLYQADLTGPVAIVLGAEGKGLRPLTRKTCDYLVAIPVQGQVSSLNVSVAAGVTLYEAVRQRQYQ